MATKSTQKIIMCKGHNSSILHCIGEQGEDNYYTVLSPFTNGKSSYCKNCVEKIYQYYLEETQSAQTALFYTLAKIDVPYIQEVYATCENKKNRAGNIVTMSPSVYITEFNRRTAISTKKDIWNDFSATNVTLGDINTPTKTREEQEQLERRWLIDWGKQTSAEDYQFLDELFYKYTENIEDIEVSQELLYRKLCMLELTYRKKDAEGASVKEELDQILKLTAKLKIDNYAEKKKKSDIEKIIEHQIWEIENTEPAEVVDKEEYKDFLDIGKSWGQSILRCVKNLLVSSKEYPNITRESPKY